MGYPPQGPSFASTPTVYGLVIGKFFLWSPWESLSLGAHFPLMEQDVGSLQPPKQLLPEIILAGASERRRLSAPQCPSGTPQPEQRGWPPPSLPLVTETIDRWAGGPLLAEPLGTGAPITFLRGLSITATHYLLTSALYISCANHEPSKEEELKHLQDE